MTARSLQKLQQNLQKAQHHWKNCEIRLPPGRFRFFLIPGAGEFYNAAVVRSHIGKGVLLAGGWILGSTLVALGSNCNSSGECDDTRVWTGAAFASMSWVASMIDAPTSAAMINRREIPVEKISPKYQQRYAKKVSNLSLLPTIDRLADDKMNYGLTASYKF